MMNGIGSILSLIASRKIGNERASDVIDIVDIMLLDYICYQAGGTGMGKNWAYISVEDIRRDNPFISRKDDTDKTFIHRLATLSNLGLLRVSEINDSGENNIKIQVTQEYHDLTSQFFCGEEE